MSRFSPIILLSVMLPNPSSSIQVDTIPRFEWITGAILPGERGLAGAVSGMQGDMLMVAGGSNFPAAMPWQGGVKKYYADGFIYKASNEGLSYQGRFSLDSTLAYAAVCSTPQGIAIAGGEDEHGLTNRAFLLNWDQKSKKVVSSPLPELPFSVSNSALAVLNDKIYLAGGEKKDDVSATFLMLDLNKLSEGWKYLPDLPLKISHAVVVAMGNDIYVVGGRKKNPGSVSTFYQSVFSFNVAERKWSKKADLPYPIAAGTGIVLNKDHIVVFGGDSGETFRRTEELIGEISSNSDPEKKKALVSEKANLQANHPGFNRKLLYYSAAKDNWQLVGELPFPTPVTTTAIHWEDKVIIPGGEIRAGVRTPNIAMAKIR